MTTIGFAAHAVQSVKAPGEKPEGKVTEPPLDKIAGIIAGIVSRDTPIAAAAIAQGEAAAKKGRLDVKG
jgi:hypothetical protein